MSLDIENIKKRIIFRSSHRGTKEMDFLMKSFVNSIINNLDFIQLKKLDIFVNLDDEDINKIKKENIISKTNIDNEIHKLFLDYKFK